MLDTSISPIYVCLLLTLSLSVCFPKNKPLLYFNILLMWVLALFRDITVGTDTLGYSDDYQMLHGFDDIYKIRHDFELGFVALIVWFKEYITTDYLPFVSLIFIPFFAGCLRFINFKQVSFPLALFFLYTWGAYFFAYNGMRQMMVLGIVLLFIPWLYQRKYAKFAIAVIITALLFHRSGIIMLSLIPVHYWITVKGRFPAKKWLYAMVWISFAMFFIGKTFLQKLLVPIISLFDVTYTSYILGNESVELGFMYNLGQSLATSLLIFLYKRGETDFEMLLFIIGISVYNIMGMFSVFGPRLAIYWTIFGIALIPRVLTNLDKKRKQEQICAFIFICYTLVIFLYSYHFNNFGEVNPYIFR